MNLHLKQIAYQKCLQAVEEKIALLQAELADLSESIRNETKSSAGDKHETARAHLQIAQEQTGKQLSEAIAQKATLERIDPMQRTSAVAKGSLIETDKGYFFMSIAVGRLTADQVLVSPLSAQSPLGLKLMGLQAGDTAILNAHTYHIITVT